MTPLFDHIQMEKGKDPGEGINDVLTLRLTQYIKAHSTQGVKANVQLKSSIYWCKNWNQPQGLYLNSQVKILKIFSICLKLVINAEIYGLVLAPRLKIGTV